MRKEEPKVNGSACIYVFNTLGMLLAAMEPALNTKNVVLVSNELMFANIHKISKF